ncbi:MAG: hypothetical protein N2606_00390 [Candidatus Omnitrophica bacterium]|nr:hypothetical protein [Candidatus Omnitrophota bacterium]
MNRYVIFKILYGLVLVIILVYFLPLYVYADEIMNITTYYPSPVGSYRTIRLFPTSTPTGNLEKEGVIYYNATDHILYYRNSTKWFPLNEDFLKGPVSKGSLCRGLKITYDENGATEWIDAGIPDGTEIQNIVIMFMGESCPVPRGNFTYYRGGFHWINYEITINPENRRQFRVQFRNANFTGNYTPQSPNLGTGEFCQSGEYGIFYTAEYYR